MKPKHSLHGVRPWSRHGLVLVVAGTVYIFIGLSYIGPEIPVARAQSLSIAFRWLSPDIWGGIFVFVGLLSMISSRWPQVSETWGYTLLTGLAAAWAMFYLTGIIFDNSPVANLSAVLIWGLTAFLWWAISGLLNPDATAVADGPG